MRIARALSAEFNPRGAAPTLYNTHQMYLRGARATLDEEAAHAAEAGYVLAVKLVRGAYMQTEPAAALQPSKGATDDAYDGAALPAAARKKRASALSIPAGWSRETLRHEPRSLPPAQPRSASSRLALHPRCIAMNASMR